MDKNRRMGSFAPAIVANDSNRNSHEETDWSRPAGGFSGAHSGPGRNRRSRDGQMLGTRNHEGFGRVIPVHLAPGLSGGPGGHHHHGPWQHGINRQQDRRILRRKPRRRRSRGLDGGYGGIKRQTPRA